MNTCTRCNMPLPLYAQALQMRECLLCQVLTRNRAHTGLHPATRDLLGALSPTRKAGPPCEPPQQVTRLAATEKIVAWARQHGSRWPVTADFGTGEGQLPSINVVRRLWGSLRQCRSALRQQYADIALPPTQVRSPASILQDVATWIAAHDGRIPLIQDFIADPALPAPSVVYTHFGGLRNFYAEYAQGQYLATYMARVHEGLRQAGYLGALAAQRRRVKNA